MAQPTTHRSSGELEPPLRGFWVVSAVFFSILAAAGLVANLAGLSGASLLGVQLYVLTLPATIFHVVLASVAWLVCTRTRSPRWHHNVAYAYSLVLLTSGLIALLALVNTGLTEALLAAAAHLTLAGYGAYEGTVLDEDLERPSAH